MDCIKYHEFLSFSYMDLMRLIIITVIVYTKYPQQVSVVNRRNSKLPETDVFLVQVMSESHQVLVVLGFQSFRA